MYFQQILHLKLFQYINAKFMYWKTAFFTFPFPLFILTCEITKKWILFKNFQKKTFHKTLSMKTNQVSISPIFYEQLFHTKVFCAAFMYLQFGFVIFWQNNFGTHKMLVKLAPDIKVTKLFTVVIYWCS